ncbi:hypothetical protein EYW49_06330 [Siculibacillus lacustris]|uniref:Uncharacterized protein n=1 Tax=Siculibacillus lacustris TaxID=1549641 RepID=A0A4Q9VWK6_9HYPH|nr:hypothetical protein [Siculibacillus lacustris]TBW39485.1 hypothetical protein EYW49_06330 [Siculibacillus lacustris]
MSRSDAPTGAGTTARRPAGGRVVRVVAAGLLAIGLIGVSLAIGWWWIVYGQLVGSTSMALADAVPCLVSRSDLCSLAQALCRNDHFLGITRYPVAAFWAAATPLGAGLAIVGWRFPIGAGG